MQQTNFADDISRCIFVGAYGIVSYKFMICGMILILKYLTSHFLTAIFLSSLPMVYTFRSFDIRFARVSLIELFLTALISKIDENRC